MGNEARMKHKFRCVSQKNLLIYLFRWFDAAKTSLESVFIITGKEGAIKGERNMGGGGGGVSSRVLYKCWTSFHYLNQ